MSYHGWFITRRSRVVGMAAAVAAALPAAGCGAARPTAPRGPYLGEFAGYVSRQRSVSAASASWTVAPILDGVDGGGGSTWVGIEAPGPPGRAPFVQVGALDNRLPAPVSAYHDRYSAFWSDVAHGFHPQLLFSVHPGDRLSAGLRVAGGRCRIAIVDHTTGRARRFTTAARARSPFNEAEWLQEDPTRLGGREGDPLGHVIYALTGPVRFTGVRLDGRPVAAGRAVSQWMTPRGTGDDRDLAPSPLSGDAFTVAPRTLGAAAARYQSIIGPANRVFERLAVRMATWTRSTPRSVYAAAAGSLLAAQRAADRRLSGVRWPAAAAGLVAQLIRADDAQASLEHRLARLAPAGLPAWRRAWARADARRGRIGQRLRSALGAPGYVPSES